MALAPHSVPDIRITEVDSDDGEEEDDAFDAEQFPLPRISSSIRQAERFSAWGGGGQRHTGAQRQTRPMRPSDVAAIAYWKEYEQELMALAPDERSRPPLARDTMAETGFSYGTAASHGTSCGSKSTDDPYKVKDDTFYQTAQSFLTTFATPVWVSYLYIATGVTNVSYHVERERERREDTFFQNDFPATYNFVTSLKFEVGVAAAIVVNSALIGWEASVPRGTLEGFFSAWEHVFVAFFLVEWCLRMVAFGWIWVFELFNFCDTVLVLGTGVLLKWVMEPTGADISFLRIFTVLRVLRLARLAKVVRFSSFFKELWMLTNGLTNSVRPLGWTMFTGVTLLYVFAVASTELIGRQTMFEGNDHVQARFGNVLRSMLTMLQMMTLNSWGNDVARPVMEVESAFGLYFVAFIAFGVFIFWNLITAIIVEHATETTTSDALHQEKEGERRKKQDLKILADAFLDLDKDGSGELSAEEFMGAMDNKKVIQVMESLNMGVRDLEDVWYVLDDGSGLLTIKDFTNGIRRMKGRAAAKDLISTNRDVVSTQLCTAELKAQVVQYGSSLEGLEFDIMKMVQDTGEIVGLFQEVYHRLQCHIDRTEQTDKVNFRRKVKAARDAELEALALEDFSDEEKDDAAAEDSAEEWE